MPGSDVTVTATFTEMQKFTVTYMSNGTQLSTETVYPNEAIANAPTPTAPTGWSFMGWTAETSYTGTTTPAYFDASTPITGAITLTAVFATVTDTYNAWQKVTSAPTDWAGEYLLVYEDEESPVAWTGLDATNCGVAVTISDGVIATKPDGAVSLIIKAMTDGYSIKVNGSDNDGKYISGETDSNKLIFTDTECLNTLASENDGVKITSNTSVLRYNTTSGQDRFRYFKSASYTSQKAVQLYQKRDVNSYIYTTSFQKTITVASMGWATACLPYNATITSSDGIAYYVTGINGSSLVKTEANVIPAGEGILINLENGGEVTFEITDGDPDDASENLLEGSLVAKTFEEQANTTYYILSVVSGVAGFYWDDATNDEGATAECNPGKAILAVKGSTGANSFSLNRDATGITAFEQQASAPYYDLLGRKVMNPSTGIYILNGKKVYVK